MKQTTTGTQHPEKLAVELARVEVAREAERRGIVDDARKRLVLESLHFFKAVADELRDPGILKECLRQGGSCQRPGY